MVDKDKALKFPEDDRQKDGEIVDALKKFGDNVKLFTIPDVISAFEQRIGEIAWQRDEAIRAGTAYRNDWLKVLKEFGERPFKDIKNLPTKELLAELNRRLDWYNSRDRDDD